MPSISQAGSLNTAFSDASGAASDLFAGFAASDQASIKAKGLNIDAEGYRLKATGDLAEASNYDLAGNLAGQNAQFTETSTALKQMQIDRANYLTVGGQQADVAGAGFAASGSALDIMRSSAAQGALTKAVAGQQGLITEAGYNEQQQSYQTLAATARTTAAGEDQIAGQTDQLAQDTIAAGKTSEIGDFVGGAIKAAGSAVAIAALFP